MNIQLLTPLCQQGVNPCITKLLTPLCCGCRTYNFWDKDSKQRLKAMSKASYGSDPAPITSGSFNADGSIYAYAGEAGEGYNTSV